VTVQPLVPFVGESILSEPQAGAVSSHPVDVSMLFAPVRSGLWRVEAKMKTVDSSIFAPLAHAFVNLIGSGGKRLRPALALLAADLVSPPADSPVYERVLALAAAVEMLHTSSLVHDDVIDGSLLRRGAPTLNALWSGGATTLAGNYMFGTAARFAAETGDMRVIELFSQTLQIIVDGELHQLQDRNDFLQPQDHYYQRIFAKTASLFCAATEGAAILCGLPEAHIQALHDYAYNFGMAFQIVDDILDFTGDDATLGKPAGSDLRQGTLTLPFFYYWQQHASPETLVEELEQALLDADAGEPEVWDATVATIVADLRSSPAIAAARAEANRFLALAAANLAVFPGSTAKTSLLGLLAYVVERTH
jgi:geranylgeranyl pyrophosphate synthase